MPKKYKLRQDTIDMQSAKTPKEVLEEKQIELSIAHALVDMLETYREQGLTDSQSPTIENLKKLFMSFETNINADIKKLKSTANRYKILKILGIGSYIGLSAFLHLKRINQYASLSEKIDSVSEKMHLYDKNPIDLNTKPNDLSKLTTSSDSELYTELEKKCPHNPRDLYVSIENSHCREKITEAFYKNEISKLKNSYDEKFQGLQDSISLVNQTVTNKINEFNQTSIDQSKQMTIFNNTLIELTEQINNQQGEINYSLYNSLKKSINLIYKSYGIEGDIFEKKDNITLDEQLDNSGLTLQNKISKADKIQIGLLASLVIMVGGFITSTVVKDRVAAGNRNKFLLIANTIFGNKKIAAHKNKFEQATAKHIMLSLKIQAKTSGYLNDKGEVIKDKKEEWAKFVQNQVLLLINLGRGTFLWDDENSQAIKPIIFRQSSYAESLKSLTAQYKLEEPKNSGKQPNKEKKIVKVIRTAVTPTKINYPKPIKNGSVLSQVTLQSRKIAVLAAHKTEPGLALGTNTTMDISI